MNTFSLLKTELQRSLERSGYKTPNAVQSRVIPLLLEGHNLFVQSKTGSGKTLAYLLPMIQNIDTDSRDIQALILAPTRELALQADADARALCLDSRIHCACIIGGMPESIQSNQLKSAPAIITATPGRLLDLLKRNMLDLSALKLTVFDEADQLFSSGQKDEVLQIRRLLPDVQTALFSATISEEQESLFPGDFIPVIMDDPSSINPDITAWQIETDDKFKILMELLKHLPITSAIIFTDYIQTCIDLSEKLQNRNILADAFSSSASQSQRNRIIRRFKEGRIRVLCATDAAARGLDIADISHIIQYDLPFDKETYIHRSGRSAHQGQTGISITLYTPSQKDMETVQYLLQNAKPMPSLPVEIQDLSSPIDKESSKHTEGVQTFIIRAGRKDKIRPGDIVGAFCSIVPYEQITAVEIQDDFSMVSILNADRHIADKARDLQIKGRRRRIEKKRNRNL